MIKKYKGVIINTEKLSFAEALQMGINKKEFDELKGKKNDVRGNSRENKADRSKKSKVNESSDGPEMDNTDVEKSVKSKRRSSGRKEAKNGQGDKTE